MLAERRQQYQSIERASQLALEELAQRTSELLRGGQNLQLSDSRTDKGMDGSVDCFSRSFVGSNWTTVGAVGFWIQSVLSTCLWKSSLVRKINDLKRKLWLVLDVLLISCKWGEMHVHIVLSYAIPYDSDTYYWWGKHISVQWLCLYKSLCTCGLWYFGSHWVSM